MRNSDNPLDHDDGYDDGLLDGSPNYVNKKLSQRFRPGVGEDAVAACPIHKGELLVLYGGVFIPRDFLKVISVERRPYFYQIAEGIWFGPADCDSLGVAERINHSCTPNTGFAAPYKLIAIRDIAVGEPVTVDYNFMQSEHLEGSDFDCHCGSDNCRRKVCASDWQRKPCHDSLISFMQPYLQVKLGYKARESAMEFSKLIFPDKWLLSGSGTVPGQLVIADGIDLTESGLPKARRAISKDEVVFLLGGRVVSCRRIEGINQLLHLGTQPPESFFRINPYDKLSIFGLHTIAPNEGGNIELRFGFMLVAKRGISEGELLELFI